MNIDSFPYRDGDFEANFLRLWKPLPRECPRKLCYSCMRLRDDGTLNFDVRTLSSFQHRYSLVEIRIYSDYIFLCGAFDARLFIYTSAFKYGELSHDSNIYKE